jgi:hypothetical protein
MATPRGADHRLLWSARLRSGCLLHARKSSQTAKIQTIRSTLIQEHFLALLTLSPLLAQNYPT